MSKITTLKSKINSDSSKINSESLPEDSEREPERKYNAAKLLRLFYQGKPQHIFRLVKTNENNNEIPMENLLKKKRISKKKSYYENILNKQSKKCSGTSKNCDTMKYILGRGDRLILKPELQISSDQTMNPLVLLVTSKIHSMLYIIKDKKLYTVGFGYYNLLDRLIPSGKIGEIYSRLGSLTETLTPLNGVLFSVDYMMPQEAHTAQISWVGYFTQEMADRLNENLSRTIFIEATVDFYKKSYTVVNNQYLLKTSNNPYLRSSCIKCLQPFNPNASISHNCLTWAEHILGVSLNCGVTKDPALCQEVTEEEIYRLIDAMNGNINKKGERETQQAVISSIQNRLIKREFPLTSVYRTAIHYAKQLKTTRRSTAEGRSRYRKNTRRTRKRRR
jgi:hypothetical protein